MTNTLLWRYLRRPSAPICRPESTLGEASAPVYGRHCPETPGGYSRQVMTQKVDAQTQNK